MSISWVRGADVQDFGSLSILRRYQCETHEALNRGEEPTLVLV